jgi:4-alpha-glucanotransferase
VDFSLARRIKMPLLEQACQAFRSQGGRPGYEAFCRRAGWLDDYALYTVLSHHYRSRAWPQWPKPLRLRRPQALAAARRRFAGAIEAQKIVQYLFFQQWRALKTYCNHRRIRLMGDMPIYVPLESADVWTHPHCFKLTPQGAPQALSGVPPDYFSATGQLWGHPVYDWPAMRKARFGWWADRLAHHFALYDLTRIDHFRGLVAYWEVPAESETAVEGQWVAAPVQDFFDEMLKRFGHLPVIAEDLGSIDAEVREVMARYGLAGMRVLLFAFGDDFPQGAFLPHQHVPHCVVYTGTHDTNTVRGWFESEADADTRRNLLSYLGREVPLEELHWEVIRLALMSTADTALIPLQDVLGLGAEARMNRPARGEGNWGWRVAADALDQRSAGRLREMSEVYGRL